MSQTQPKINQIRITQSIDGAGYKAINFADATNPTDLVTLQQAQLLVAGLWDDRGNYNASSNTFPTTGGSGVSGAIMKGDIWTISTPGMLGSKAVSSGDTVRALSDSPGQTSTNWSILGSGSSLGYTAENVTNKVVAFSSPTDTQYPSAKLVNDQLATKLSISDIISAVFTSHVVNLEVPSGNMNGSNMVFTLAHTPVSGSVQVFWNGLLMKPGTGNDYTISGSTITFITATSPISTDNILVNYWM